MSTDPPPDHLATRARPVPVDGLDQRQRQAASAAGVVPLLGALCGGSFVGFGESMYILFSGPQTGDYSGIAYALLLYGFLGLVLGLLGSAAAVAVAALTGRPPDPSRSWTGSFLLAAGVLSLWVLGEGLSHDRFGGGALPPLWWAGLLAGFGAFSVVFWLFVRNALAKTFFGFLLEPPGTLRLWVSVLAVWVLIALAMKLWNEDAAELSPRPVAPGLEDRSNILLVVAEGLRADALGAYGAPGDPTPVFDRLTREGILYESAITQASRPRPAVASLLTSSVPCYHRCQLPSDRLPEDVTTLAEALAEHGYTTGGVVTSLDLTASFNMQQGFDTWQFLRPQWPVRGTEASVRLVGYGQLRKVLGMLSSRGQRPERYYRPGREVAAAGTRWLQRHGAGRWFLMLHFMDPHEPWFQRPLTGRAFARDDRREPSPEDISEAKQLYSGEVRYWDRQLGALVDWLEQRGLLDTTTLVVTGTRGTSLGEHGRWWDEGGMSDGLVRVPLLVRPADADPSRRRRVTDLVRLMDVAPTLTEVAGASVPPTWQGISLLREYELRDADDRVAWIEGPGSPGGTVALRDRDWLYTRSPARSERASTEGLYFHRTDPEEASNLVGEETAQWALDARRNQLERLRGRYCAEPELPQVEFDQQECEALRRLGYLKATGNCSPP